MEGEGTSNDCGGDNGGDNGGNDDEATVLLVLVLRPAGDVVKAWTCLVLVLAAPNVAVITRRRCKIVMIFF